MWYVYVLTFYLQWLTKSKCNEHQTIYHIHNGQWLMPDDSRRRWSGDCPFAPFCLLLAIRLLVALTMIAMALLGALMIHKHPASLLEISLLSPTWYREDFDWLCIRCVLCLLVLLYDYQTILICQDFFADTELQLAWPGAEVSKWLFLIFGGSLTR